MKLLSIGFEGLKTFKDGKFSIDFFSTDRVPASDESVSVISKPLYTNNIIAIAGINASGKTSSLMLIRMALYILNGRSIDSPFLRTTFDLFDSYLKFNAVFWNDDDIWILESNLTDDESLSEDLEESFYVFSKECLYRYSGAAIAKKDLSDFSKIVEKSNMVSERLGNSKYSDGPYISPTISIVATIDKTVTPVAMLGADSSNPFKLDRMENRMEKMSALRLLDSNIEYLNRFDGDEDLYELKMKHDPEPKIASPNALQKILSSGTLRGLRIIEGVLFVLDRGGYAIVDELESHLNKQLVKVIIGIFASRETNPYGATLIFTTHYPEILDSVHRKDNTYFLIRDAEGKADVVKYSSAVERIENKKSEVFLSNWIKGTAPKYSDIDNFLSWIKDSVGE